MERVGINIHRDIGNKGSLPSDSPQGTDDIVVSDQVPVDDFPENCAHHRIKHDVSRVQEGLRAQYNELILKMAGLPRVSVRALP